MPWYWPWAYRVFEDGFGWLEEGRCCGV